MEKTKKEGKDAVLLLHASDIGNTMRLAGQKISAAIEETLADPKSHADIVGPILLLLEIIVKRTKTKLDDKVVESMKAIFGVK